MDTSLIKSFAKERGFEDVEFLGRWKNFDVYSGVVSEEDSDAAIGLPYYILADGQNIMESEYPKEYHEIFDLLESEEEEEEDEEDE